MLAAWRYLRGPRCGHGRYDPCCALLIRDGHAAAYEHVARLRADEAKATQRAAGAAGQAGQAGQRLRPVVAPPAVAPAYLEVPWSVVGSA